MLFDASVLKTLFSRVGFLSQKLFPPSHQFVFVLSRLSSSSSSSAPSSVTAATHATVSSSHTTASTGSCSSVPSSASTSSSFGFDLSLIANQLIQIVTDINNQHNSTATSATAIASSFPSSESFLEECEVLRQGTGASPLSIDFVILSVLRWAGRALQWGCVVAGVQQANHLSGEDINVEGVVGTLSSMFRETLNYSSGSAGILTARYLLKCFRDALSQSAEGFAPFVDHKAFARFLNQVEFTEVPKHTLMQLFPSVIRSLGRVDLCLLDSPPFYVMFSSSEVTRKDQCWLWSLPHSSAPPSAARFPFHLRFLTFIESICNKPVPSLQSTDVITVGKLSSLEFSELTACMEAIAKDIQKQFGDLLSLLSESSSESSVTVHTNQSQKEPTLQERALQGFEGQSAKLFWTFADLSLGLRLLCQQLKSTTFLDEGFVSVKCPPELLSLRCSEDLLSLLVSRIGMKAASVRVSSGEITDFTILPTAVEVALKPVLHND